MTSPRMRVVAVLTHPVQYLSAWFQHIHAHAPEIDLTVVYATEPTPAQQGVGFGRDVQWDVPLREGYQSLVVRPAAEGVSLSSHHFRGIDVPEIGDAVRQQRPDVALIAGWHSVTEVRAIASLRRAGVPLLYRGDSHLGTMHPRWPALSRLRARWLLGQFAGYLAVGTRSREYLRAMGAPDPAIVWSPHAVANDAFRARADAARPRRADLRRAYGFAADERVLLYAGKLAAVKRPADAIEAASRMARVAVLFVGDGDERRALEALAAARGVHAVFAGFVNQQRIAEAYCAADCLVVPGLETWGLVANEALASGLPAVLSSAAGSAADLAAAGVCAVATYRDASSLADAVTALVDAPGAADVAARCQAHVSRWSFDAATEGLVTAARFAVRNARPVQHDAPARIIALCGNMVFAGGMERITFEALSAARRGGADVQCLLNGWSSRPIANLAEATDLSWVAGHYDAPLVGLFRSPLRLLGAMVQVARASAQLLRLTARRRATHLFAADFRAVLVHAPALAVARVAGIPVILRSGVAPTPTAFHARLWRWAIRPLVTYHVANSAFTAGELRRAGIKAARVTTIANIAPRRVPPAVAPTRDPRRVAYVGQVIPEKGVLQLLDAVALLVSGGLDVRVDIAGDIEGWAPAAVHDYRTAVRARSDGPDLAGRVRFLGWCEDIATVLGGAALHCCPSQPAQREAFGITVVEAKQAGIPSVVCPSGALPELIEHRRDGWIANGFDAAAIAEGLRWFLADPERLRQAQAAARASAARFDSATFDSAWQRVFAIHEPTGRAGAPCGTLPGPC